LISYRHGLCRFSICLRIRGRRRFLTDPSPEDLERFFYLDAVALAEVAKKRGPHNRLGWAVQWGTVRMLGTFLADPGYVPHVAVEYVAEQMGVADPSCIKNYPDRLPTQHEHAREIRGLLGYREFAGAEAEVRAFVASRAAQTRDSRRELFDRAVLWLIEGRVLLLLLPSPPRSAVRTAPAGRAHSSP
jgi:hypothetical protein